MATKPSRFVLRFLTVVALIAGGATAAVVIASNTDDGPERTGTTPTTTTAGSPTPSGSATPDPGAADRCRAAALRLAEVDFAIRERWKTYHARVRQLERPREKGEVYSEAAHYFGVLEDRLRTLKPEGALQQIHDLFLRAVETSIQAARKLATAFSGGDDDLYQEAVDILNQSSAYHDAADRQLRRLDCEQLGS